MNTRSRWFRVLVVDDDIVQAQVLQRLLARCGVCCDTAAGGSDALVVTDHAQYDLVLMDCHMPGLDGFETTGRIRRRDLAEGRHRVPVIAMTAESGLEPDARYRQAGMDDYIAKPLTPDVVEALLMKWRDGVPQSEMVRPYGQEALPFTTAVPDRNGPSLLDMVVITRLQTVMGSRFDALLATYFETAASHVLAIREAIAGRDPGAVSEAAHALRGSSGLMGLRAVMPLARELEQVGRDGHLPDLARVGELESVLQSVRQQLVGDPS